MTTPFHAKYWAEGLAMPDEFLTLAEIAKLLRIAEKTAYTIAQKGKLPAFKVRGQWRFKRADLDHWLKDQNASARDDKHRGDA